MSIARRLGVFLTETRTEDLPAQTLENAAMVIASTLSSAACGTRIGSARIIRDLARDQGGRPDASIWFDTGDKLPAASAIQVNAMLSDAAASDDSDLRNIMHAGTPLTAAALAFAEREGANGDAVLTAMVLGYEAAGRISEAITPGFKDRGFHACIGAGFAAAVASGRLLGLDAEQMAHAIALTATSVGGLATAADTSVSREYHAGVVAKSGAWAALAAQRGFTGEPRILETKKGFFEAFGGVDGAAAGEAAVKDLGKTWDIVTDMAIKMVPGGHPFHAIGEAAGNAARQGDLRAEQIDSIMIHRPGMTALTGPKYPVTLIDMAHSPTYFAAAGAAGQGFSWMHARPEMIADPVVHDLIDKVRLVVERTPHADRFRQGATVTIRAKDGRFFSSTVYEPKGSAALGIAWEDVDEKYRTLMPEAGVLQLPIEESLVIIHEFRRVTDMAWLTELLRVHFE